MTRHERELLESARSGDEGAFGRLVASHRSALHAHCYRMLGSVQDAEDALQETLLNAWRALGGRADFEGRSSLKSWLYRIATNACLKTIERRPKRVLPIDYAPAADPHDPLGEPLIESVWIEPYPDAGIELEASPDGRYEQRESLELAFVAALQHIPARQRAVLILRDVLAFSAKEVAETLEMTPAAVDTALQRAHKTVDERLPAQSQQDTLQAIGDERLRELVDGFVDAWERADVDSVVAMLAHDAIVAMPPVPSWYRGRDAAAIFLRTVALSTGTRWRLLPISANGQLGFAGYRWNENTKRFVGRTVVVLTIAEEMITDITAFVSPQLFPHFGLPERLEP